MSLATRFFFVQVGSFLGVLTYFLLRGDVAPQGLVPALAAGLLVHLAYEALARRAGERKYFDVSLRLMLVVGLVAAVAGIEPLRGLFVLYSPVILFVTLGLTAVVPPLLGRESFVYWYARRQAPPAQQALPEFHAIVRIFTGLWALVFFAAAALAAAAPRDFRFTTLYPNLLVFVVGMPASYWLPPLYLRLFASAPAPPDAETQRR